MINLLYCANSRIFNGLLLSSLSARLSTDEEMHIYVLSMDLTDQNPAWGIVSENERAYLEKSLKEVNENTTVEVVNLREPFLSGLKGSPNLSTSYTPYTLLRLFVGKVEGLSGKAIYLDCDTLVIRNINELNLIELDGYEYAGVLDHMGQVFINPKYINAGVLLLNLDEIKKTRLFERSVELLAIKRYAYPDQDAIFHLTKKKRFLPKKFNEQRRLHDDTVIQHFCKGIRWFPFFKIYNIKPWQREEFKKRFGYAPYAGILDKGYKLIDEFKEEK